MMDNAHYIRQHLAEVSLPEGMEDRIETLCQHLLTTHQKVMSTMAAAIWWTEGQGDLSKQEIEQMEQILQEPLAMMNSVVKDLSEFTTDSSFFLGRLLVTESATNILNAFNDAADAGDQVFK
jgi:uncharacterized protein YaeQ